MVKVILQLYPVIPAANEEERAALRPIGRNRERYQETLTGWHDIIRAADNLGLWGVATIEHHFWSEGYECGPNPGVLDAYWAAITKNVRVGQMGYVMSTQNPMRVAEETAIIDHLTQGRCFVGFARGYQSRWTNVVGQHLGTRATISPTAGRGEQDHMFAGDKQQSDVDDDAINRRIFEEEVDIVVKAWTEDSIAYKGESWQIPFPFDKGVDDWPLAQGWRDRTIRRAWRGRRGRQRPSDKRGAGAIYTAASAGLRRDGRQSAERGVRGSPRLHPALLHQHQERGHARHGVSECGDRERASVCLRAESGGGAHAASGRDRRKPRANR